MKRFYFFCTVIIKYIFSPFFGITILGPFIQGINLRWLRNKWQIPYEGQIMKVCPNHQVDNIKTIMDNHWAYAINDFNVQELIVLLTIFLIISTLLNNILFNKPECLIHASSLRNNQTMAAIILTFIISIIGIICFVNGYFANPKYVKLYLPENGLMDGGFRIPSLKSPLTIFRLLTTIVGFYVFYWNTFIVKKSYN